MTTIVLGGAEVFTDETADNQGRGCSGPLAQTHFHGEWGSIVPFSLEVPPPFSPKTQVAVT